MRASFRTRRGSSSLGCLLQLAFVVAIVYVGVMVADDAVGYYRLRDAMRREARFAGVRTDQQIKERLLAFTDSVKVPRAARNINVVRENKNIRIWSEYDAVVSLPLFRYSRTFHLRPSAEQNF